FVSIDSADETSCGNDPELNVYSTVSGSTSEGVWSTSGTGSFSPDDSTLDAVYEPSREDIDSGSVVLEMTAINACAASDTEKISVTPAPAVDGGGDYMICESDTAVQLNGSVSGVTTTGKWSIISGDGTFLPNDSDLTATYELGAADDFIDTATLALTSTDNGICNAVTDTFMVIQTSTATTDAGNDQTVCATDDVELNGSISGGTGQGIWTTTGSGTFSDSSDLNATYSFSSADTAADTITLVLTSINACINDTDSVDITTSPIPNVNAGSDTSVCENITSASLDGTVSGATTTGEWSTLSDRAFVDSSDLNTSYILSEDDTAGDSTDVILTSTNNGGCIPVSDTMTISFYDAPIADAGDDQNICFADTLVNLDGNVSNGTSTGQWSTNGSGTFSPDDSTLDATYHLSDADSSMDTIEFYLTSTNNGGCAPVTDTMIVNQTTIPEVDAGMDRTACANSDFVTIGSIEGGASSGKWTTLGGGTFTPDDTSMSTKYNFSAGDTAIRFVDLVLTSTDACENKSDTVHVNINPAPLVKAGTDDTVCANNATVNLDGSVSDATTTGTWETLGDGTFSPSQDSLDAQYSAGPLDTSNGEAVLVLESTIMVYVLPKGILNW
ncbi:MAG: hypothetical protein ABEH43_10415, partial [Flavobacteriales bacterium]